MAIHQVSNSIGGDVCNLYSYSDAECAPHFHRSFEWVFQRKGASDFIISDRNYRLEEGTMALIFPYEVHSFTVPQGAECLVGVFSASLFPAFSGLCAKKRPKQALFTPSHTLKNLSERWLNLPLPFDGKPSAGEKMRLKTLLYAISAEFLEQVPLVEKTAGQTVFSSLVDYIDSSFREDISLKTASAALGYHEQYLSRVLHSALNMNFKTLVNLNRYDATQRLLESGEKSVADAAFESGFQSLRTYYRVCRDAELNRQDRSKQKPRPPREP